MIQVLALLLALQLCGELLARLLQLPLPGALVGMLLLLVGLLVRGRIGPRLEAVSQVLLQNLMLLFIPLIAGVMVQADYLATQWLPFVAACVGGALLSLLVSAWVLGRMLERQNRRGRRAR